MKRKETELRIFSNHAMSADPKFKKRLRSQLSSLEQAGAKRARRERRKGAGIRYVLVPVLAFAIAAVLVGVNLGQPGGNTPGKPFGSAKVSAAEIISRSDDAMDNDASNEYRFLKISDSTIYTPLGEKCDVGNFVGDTSKRYETYFYHDADSKVEAMYSKETDLNGRIIQQQSVYDDTEKEVIEPKIFLNTSSIPSLSTYFEPRDYANDEQVYFMTDKAGNRIENPDVAVSQQDGKDVYVLYALSNPKSEESMLHCWPEGSNRDPKSDVGIYIEPDSRRQIIELVIDARNYELISRTSYLGSIADANLLMRYETSREYSNPPQEQALAAMKAAGFDQANAQPEHYGHD